jgi:hypothetical protein
MAHQRFIGIEHQPEELAPTLGGRDDAATQPRGELVRSPGLASDRARVEDDDIDDATSDHVLGQAATDDLDLGKLRHPR